MKTDIVVIGGGLAGMSAAYEAASLGLEVCIVEETWSLGGQLRQQTQFINGMPAPFADVRGYQVAEELGKHIESLPVHALFGHTLVGLFAEGQIGVANDSGIIPIQAKKVIMATGAAETPVAFPGWTSPGIMTIGAAQQLINRERVLPGKQTVVVGSSDFALEVVMQLLATGVHVLAVVEQSRSLQAENPQMIESFTKHNIPVFLNSQVISAEGKGRVAKVKIGDRNDSIDLTELDVDFVCVDGGRHPILEPFSLFSCDLHYQARLGGWLPRYDTNLETSASGLFAAGNAAGITHQAGVFLTGGIAGLAAAIALDVPHKKSALERKQMFWSSLAKVESGVFQATWEARITHMEQSGHELLSKDPLDWKTTLTKGGR